MSKLIKSGTPPMEVRGRVTNEDGEPLAGVTVLIKGTNIATATDKEGEFELNKIEPNAVLVLTAVNIESFEVKVNGKSKLGVRVKEKTKKLDEVQVIAYGTTSQRFTTGNVSTVRAEEIEKQPVNNLLSALQGKVPGLMIA